MPYPHVCRVCGTPFTSKRPAQKYCSRECYFSGSQPWSTGLTAETDTRLARIAQKKLKNVVDRESLHNLYEVQNLTLRAIGKLYGVSKHTIKRLVIEYGLQRVERPYDSLTDQDLTQLYLEGHTYKELSDMFSVSQSIIGQRIRRNGINGRSYRNKAAVNPSPELLRKLYWDEWLPYEEVGRRLNVDFTTIPYWLKKFDIPRRKAWQSRRDRNWQQPDIEVVRHLYEAEELSAHSIGQLFDVTGTAIKMWLKQAGVTMRKSGYPNIAHYTAEDGHRVKSGLELQVDNWLFQHGIPHGYEPFIGNTRYKADFKVGDYFIEIWGIEGNQAYDQKRTKKLAVYQQLSLSLISLYPNHFPHLEPLHILLESVS